MKQNDRTRERFKKNEIIKGKKMNTFRKIIVTYKDTNMGKKIERAVFFYFLEHLVLIETIGLTDSTIFGIVWRIFTIIHSLAFILFATIRKERRQIKIV